MIIKELTPENIMIDIDLTLEEKIIYLKLLLTK